MGLLNKLKIAMFGSEEEVDNSAPIVKGSQYYIYPKDKAGKRTGLTLCVMLHDGRIFHGTANCSEEDQFNKSTGRKISLIRAQSKVARYEARKLRG